MAEMVRSKAIGPAVGDAARLDLELDRVDKSRREGGRALPLGTGGDGIYAERLEAWAIYHGLHGWKTAWFSVVPESIYRFGIL